MKIKFYEAVGALKSLPRTGWVKCGIPDPESVAAHSFRAQFIAYDFAKELGADPARCALMMLVHDLPEARAGDMTPDCPITPAAKAVRELKAAKTLAKLSQNPEFLSLFEEFEARETLCAQICYDADKLECLLQALEYERAYPEKRALLQQFWESTPAIISTEPGKRMLKELQKARRALHRPKRASLRAKI